MFAVSFFCAFSVVVNFTSLTFRTQYRCPKSFLDSSFFPSGVLYYEGSAANGVRITDYVEELKDRASFDRFILGSGPDDHVLKVVV